MGFASFFNVSLLAEGEVVFFDVGLFVSTGGVVFFDVGLLVGREYNFDWVCDGVFDRICDEASNRISDGISD